MYDGNGFQPRLGRLVHRLTLQNCIDRPGLRRLAALLCVTSSLAGCSAVEDFLKTRDEFEEDTSHYWSTPNTPSNSQKYGAANVAIRPAQRADPTVRRIEDMIASQMFSWANKQEGAPIQVPYIGQQPSAAAAPQPSPQPWQQAQPAIQPPFQPGSANPYAAVPNGAFDQGFAGQGPVSLITGRRIRLSDDYKGLIADSENARYDRMFSPWNPNQAAWGMPQPNSLSAYPPASHNGWTAAQPGQPGFGQQPQPWQQGQGQLQGQSWLQQPGQGQAWPAPLPWQQGQSASLPPNLVFPPSAAAQQPFGQAWGQMQQGGPLLGAPNGAVPLTQEQAWGSGQGMPWQQQQAFAQPGVLNNPYVTPGMPPVWGQAQQLAQQQAAQQQLAQPQTAQLGIDPNFPPWAQPSGVPSPGLPSQGFPWQAGGLQGLPTQQAQGYGLPKTPPPAAPQDWRVGTPPAANSQEPYNSITPPWPSSVDVATLPQQGTQPPSMPSNRLYTEYANERTDVAQSAQALAAQRAMQRQNLTFEDLRSNSIIQSPLYADAIAPADGKAPAAAAASSALNPAQMVGSFALGEFFGSDLAYMPDVRGHTSVSVVPDPDAKPLDHPFKGLESTVDPPDQLDAFFNDTDSFIQAMQDVDPLYHEEAPTLLAKEAPTPTVREESPPEASALTYKKPSALVAPRSVPLPPPPLPKLDTPLFAAPQPVAVAPLDVDEKQTAAVMDERRQLSEKAVKRQPSDTVDVATIYFHRSDNRLTEDDWHIINQVAKLHKQYDGVVMVHGYASTLAPDGLPRSYEDSLNVSTNQANAVAKALIEQGLDARQIRIKGFAEMTPRVVGHDKLAKAATASRVEISFAY